MFMSDKPLNQQRLARNLAGLVDVLTTRENTLNFIEGFWKIMSREWNAIDSLRLDKYLYLIRCYVRKGFELCLGTRGQKWKLIDDYLAILRNEGGPLSSRDPKVSVGLRLHVLDIWVDELDKEDTKRTAPVETFIAPLRALVKETLTTSVRKRAQEALDDERVEDWKNEKPKAKIDEDGEDAEMSDRPDQGEEEGNAEFAGFDD
jgi:ribosomal RNA-processing protein 1